MDFWDSLVRTGSALAVVLGLMAVLAWGARRALGQRAGSAGAGPLVRVVASGYIGPRKTIALVSVAGDYLIVGATANDLVDLGRVTDPAAVQALLTSSGSVSSPTPSTPFAVVSSWLDRLAPAGGHNKESHGDR